jgi:hypothetical protein
MVESELLANNPCFACDPGSARLLDQAVAKFAETSAQTVAASQQNFVLAQGQAWREALQQEHERRFASFSLQLKAVQKMFDS